MAERFRSRGKQRISRFIFPQDEVLYYGLHLGSALFSSQKCAFIRGANVSLDIAVIRFASLCRTIDTSREIPIESPALYRRAFWASR